MKLIIWCIVASALWNLGAMPKSRTDCAIYARYAAIDSAISLGMDAETQAGFERGTYESCRSRPWWTP
jgi:hypothetical protein